MSKSSMPITDSNDLNELKDVILHHSSLGMRDYTIWEISEVTLVSMHHLVQTKYSEVYNADGSPKAIAKLDGAGYFYLKPCWKTLRKYSKWLKKYHLDSGWMFPSFPSTVMMMHHRKPGHVSSSRFYMMLNQMGKKVGLKNLGNETPRRTGALQVYHQTHNIGIVMQMLHQKDLIKVRNFLGLSGCDHSFIIHSLNKVIFN